MDTRPTIKGIFVNSHIKILKEKMGEEGLQKLEKLYGSPVQFDNDADIPVREEVRILEYVLDLLHPNNFTPQERAYEAGKLHFTNFSGTPLAKILFTLFAKKFRLLMLQSKNIAGHVFKGVKFSSKDLGEHAVEVTMENNDYPVEHFTGFFQAWLDFSGLKGTVTGEKTNNVYVYTMQWE